jgi:hypothetical protein
LKKISKILEENLKSSPQDEGHRATMVHEIQAQEIYK